MKDLTVLETAIEKMAATQTWQENHADHLQALKMIAVFQGSICRAIDLALGVCAAKIVAPEGEPWKETLQKLFDEMLVMAQKSNDEELSEDELFRILREHWERHADTLLELAVYLSAAENANPAESASVTSDAEFPGTF